MNTEIGAIIARIRKMFTPTPPRPEKPWLVDRDGRVYPPTRRVVLKARKPAA